MKYLLDTCVVSETRRREPNANLMNWLAERQAADLFVSVVTLGELRKGACSLKDASRRQIPFVKRGFKTFPAVKITRLGVRKEFHGKHIGSALIATVKRFFLDDNRTGCRFVTVDAYRAATSFYERNGFVRTKGTEDGDAPTVPLFFDLLRLEAE